MVGSEVVDSGWTEFVGCARPWGLCQRKYESRAQLAALASLESHCILAYMLQLCKRVGCDEK
jgi:hypothetical protein